MPVYQLSSGKRSGFVGFEGGGEVHVLDQVMAVKDGVLGGESGGFSYGGVCEKMDLKKMIEELKWIEIPPVFICPISLEPMQDPVTLCTGQTFERSNIRKWFDLGHFTCPTTMQELWDDSITPNTTLYHLIHIWFSQKYLLMKKRSEDVLGRASELLKTLKNVKGQARIENLKELHQLVASHVNTRKTVVDENGASLLSSLLGSFTSHSVGSEVIGILAKLPLDSDSKSNMMRPSAISLMVDMLNEGSIETKISCVKLMESLMSENIFRPEIVSNHSLLIGIMRLVGDNKHPDGITAGLALLKTIISHKQVRNLIITMGAIPQLVKLIPNSDIQSVELNLIILEALSSLPEGKTALKDCSKTIPNMVRLLMRVSENCNQNALSVLWSLFKLDPAECSAIAIEEGLAAKLLLVIQSGCNSVLKQSAAELLKLCSLNYSDTIFISKCKLSRTIQ